MELADLPESLALGRWQREILWRLRYFGAVRNPVSELRGKAKHWELSYKESFTHLLNRIKAAGYTVTVQLGPRGGYWSATYTVTKPNLQ